MATPQQIKCIHTLKSKLGLENDDYLNLLSGLGVQSSKELNFEGAQRLIRILQAQADGGRREMRVTQIKRKYSGIPRSCEQATVKQLRLVEGLWMEKARVKTTEALDAFIRRVTPDDGLLDLKQRNIQKVVKALQNIKEGK